MPALEVSEIRSMMGDLEKAGGSTERILALLTVFEERVKPTEKLLRACIFKSEVGRSVAVLITNILMVLLGNKTGYRGQQVQIPRGWQGC